MKQTIQVLQAIGHGTSRGTEEISCGNSSGQLKKKWNLQV